MQKRLMGLSCDSLVAVHSHHVVILVKSRILSHTLAVITSLLVNSCMKVTQGRVFVRNCQLTCIGLLPRGFLPSFASPHLDGERDRIAPALDENQRRVQSDVTLFFPL